MNSATLSSNLEWNLTWNWKWIPACHWRAGQLTLDKALDLIGYLRLETHTVPLLDGLGYLGLFYRIVEKRNEHDVKHNLAVRRRAHTACVTCGTISNCVWVRVWCCLCFWRRRISCAFSAVWSTSRHGATEGLYQSDGWGQRSSRWLATWKTLPVWSEHVRASDGGFSPMEHSSLFDYGHYSLTLEIICHHPHWFQISQSETLKVVFACV